MDSNISFPSNVNIIRSISQSKGDEKFLRNVKDYTALCKLLKINKGSTNSSFYIFSPEQVRIKSQGHMLRQAETPEEIAENERLEKEYGYKAYDESALAPLLDETYIEYGRSIWESTGVGGWIRPGFYSDGYSGKLGRWEEAGKQQGTVEVYGGGSLFTTYIKQESQRIEQSGVHVPIETAEFPELTEADPYYYRYRETAGAPEEDALKEFEGKEASAYLQKYGFYSAFEATEQETVIRAAADKNIFVDAGPGTGKTYTLMHKLNYMVSELEVDPEGILVLCFSRAAVAEIKKRRDEFVEHGGSRGLRKIDIRTFHSFAWWLIGEANNEFTQEDGWYPVNMGSLSYDGCIAKASGIIRRFTEEVMGGWSHFIVDEIQDLTDARARFVLNIVRGCLEVGCGLTVLGDSCQAIYDYNAERTIDPMDSQKFYRALFSILYGKASFFKLELNHRQTQSLIGMTTGLREAILSEKMSRMKQAVGELFTSMKRISEMDILGQKSQETLSRIAGDENVCLLCRNNGQVLSLSAQLHKRGVTHVVNAYDRERCYAAWIGRVFSQFEKETVCFDEFEELMGEYADNPGTAEEIWQTVANMLGKGENTRLGTNDVLRAVYLSRRDDPELYNRSESNIIVSNIHKAKGREYSVVILEENFMNKLIRKRNEIGEYKTLYVAITRPKEQLFATNMDAVSGLRLYPIFATNRKRWVKYVNKEITYVEVRGNLAAGTSDVDVQSFNRLGPEVQKYIAHNICPGDEIILRKSRSHELFGYHIIHVKDEEETVIGRCNERLGEDLQGILCTDDTRQWPAEIRELYVADVFTNIDERVTMDDRAVGSDCVWNWVAFYGMGRMVFDVY